MNNDPLEAVFVTGDEAATLKRADTARKLATYLERMPVELRGMFAAEFQHINRAELLQLRDYLQAETVRADTLSSARNVLAAQLQAARSEIAQQSAQLEQAREVIRRAWILADLETSKQDVETDSNTWQIEADTRSWLAANAQQAVSAFAAIDKLMSEHPDLFKDDQQEQSA